MDYYGKRTPPLPEKPLIEGLEEPKFWPLEGLILGTLQSLNLNPFAYLPNRSISEYNSGYSH